MADITQLLGGDFDAQKYRKADGYSNHIDPKIAAIEELKSAGFNPPMVLPIGKLVRMDAPDDKTGQKTGWAVYQEYVTDNAPIGVMTYGSWRGNPEKVTWCNKATHYMSDDERNQYNERIEAARISQEIALKERQDAAKEKAQEIWAKAPDLSDGHEYIVRKGIKAHGLKLNHDGDALVPIYNSDGELVSLQFIAKNGKKMFLSGGQIKGCFCTIQGDDTAVVCEGYATGYSIYAATGHTVYVAFNAGNLMPVTTMAVARHKSVIVGGDNDHQSDGNIGKSKAEAAALLNHCDLVLPPSKAGVTDFNDLDLDEVKELFAKKPQAKKPVTDKTACPIAPHGWLSDIEAYYNVTARAPQPLFATQTAIALASIILGRVFKTNKQNFASLYFLNVAKSSTGKEHVKTVIEDVLNVADMGHLVVGSGYTSAGAVFSTLLRLPRHVTIIDEFGRYLEAAKSQKNSSLQEANTQLMEAISRCHGIARPMSYSTMTLPKDKQNDLANRKILNPAITLMTMTTPSALFKSIDASSIADGFLNRFIIAVSDAERTLRDHKDHVDVPQKIIDWITAIEGRKTTNAESPEIKPDFIELTFTDAAMSEQRKFEQYCIDCANKWETMNMAEMSGRSAEMAMRLSLIVALTQNQLAEKIEKDHMAWACAYIKWHLENTLQTLKLSVSNNQHESDKKAILKAIRESADGITWAMMMKRPPFSQHKRKDLQDILTALQDAELITMETEERAGRGRPSVLYKSLED